MEKVLIILGPTAVGKSEIAIHLAKKFNGEIISADSVQVYKGLNIGSAKLSFESMQGIKHHFIDVLPPESEFSVFEFVEMTKKKIHEITKNKKIPIIAGGTGLYIKALLHAYDFGGAEKNKDFRKSLEEKDLNVLYDELTIKNKEMASSIKPNDKKRIIRALEILEFGNVPNQSKTEYDALIFNLNMDRQKLYEKINKRVDKMLEEGLIDEVKSLLKCIKKDSQSMKAIGYKEVVSYLDNEISLEEMKELIKKHTRNYAKRQMTFFRSLKEAFCIDVMDKTKALNEIEKTVKEWL